MKLLKLIERYRTRRRLAAGLREAAAEKFALGAITSTEYDKCVQATNDSKALDEMLLQFEVNKDALGGFWPPDWEAIKAWIIENWPTILRIVLTVIMLLEVREGKYDKE